MMAPVRSSARSTLAKTVAASPAASQTRPTRAPSSTKLVQRTLTTSLGLSKDPPPVDSAVRQAVAAHLSKSAAGSSGPVAPPTGVDLPSTSSTSAPPPSETTLADFYKFFPRLKENQLPLVQLELETVGRDWLEILSRDMATPGFLQLKQFVLAEQKKQKVYPPPEDIYAFTRFSKLADVKVVVIGQDPYHQPGQAHGLSFSVRRGVKTPPSLRNIYKELSLEYPNFTMPTHGDLSSWAEQGILLLNTSLTVRHDTAASHSSAGWVPFTQSIISHLANDKTREKGLVFFVWGKHAEKMLGAAKVDTKRHLILKSAHPSPLSASRGFFNTGHFRQADEWIKKEWETEEGIDWASVNAK